MVLAGKVTASLVAAEHSPKGHPALPSVPTLLLKGRIFAPFQPRGNTLSLPSPLQLLREKKWKFLKYSYMSDWIQIEIIEKI